MTDSSFQSDVSADSNHQAVEGNLSSTLLVHNAVGILYNPISGAGMGERNSIAIKDTLENLGITAELRQTKREYPNGEIKKFLDSVDVLLVAGGDGTLMGLIPELKDHKTPVYLIPSGNESLFARSFGMSTRPEDIVAAIRQAKVNSHYYGICDERPFFLMGSVGFDSKVIDRIDRTRTSSIGHIGYVIPVIEQLLSYQPPKITLEVDGKVVVDDTPGFLIIANRPEYALGLDLVPEAESQVPELTARFFPNHQPLELVIWLLNKALGYGIPTNNCSLFTGNSFTISVSNPDQFPIQFDGEAGGITPVTITSSTSQVRVLEGVR